MIKPGLIAILLLLTGCASDFIPPPPQCSYLEHYEFPCNEKAVLTSEEGKRWSCKIPNPHYADDNQHCKWDKN